MSALRRPLDQPERLLHRFVHACATGDLAALVILLADDVTVWTDGGGANLPTVPIPMRSFAAF